MVDKDKYRYSYGDRHLEMDVVNREANEEAAQDYLRIMLDEDDL
ncbi:MAG: hypothetical protein ACOY31_03705 [Bacillota bacterium]